MDPTAQMIKSKARTFADNHSIILEVQQSWQQMEQSQASILKARDHALCLKIRQQLHNFLCRLETVKEVNPILRDSKSTLVKDIGKYAKLLDGIVSGRKSFMCVVVPEPDPDREGPESSGDGSQAEDAHMNSNQITTDVDESEIHDQQHMKGITKEPSATQNKTNNFIRRLSNVVERIVTCGSDLQA